MNTVVIKRGFYDIMDNLTIAKSLALAGIIALIFYAPTRDILLSSLSEAYYQVSVFVAATLMGLMLFERVKKRGMHEMLSRHSRWQVLIAAVLGAVPGCGGSIFVVTQYIRGSMSFGGVVATLTATMGDAAFLLLARAPAAAVQVFAVCFVVGALFGWLIDRLHGRDFLRVKAANYNIADDIRENKLLSPFYILWMSLFAPGAVMGVLYAAQVDVPAVFALGGIDWVGPFGAAAAMLAITMWALNPLSDIRLCIAETRPMMRRVTDTTNFITFWVLCGFVGYGLIANYFQFDLATLFGAWLWFLPLAGVLVGFIPGCGPQVVVTTLFLNGAIPMSAQMANAISNDGDALFPAVAIAPKASIIASIYTAIPALFIGYAWMFLFEIG